MRWATTSVSVSVAKTTPVRLQLVLQLAEILDDAVVDERQPVGGVRVGVGLGRRAMRRPARMADAGVAGQRLAGELVLEVAELALGAPAGQVPAFQRRHTGRIVAAIFEPLQRIDEQRRHRRLAENPDNAAHRSLPESDPALSIPFVKRLRPQEIT